MHDESYSSLILRIFMSRETSPNTLNLIPLINLIYRNQLETQYTFLFITFYPVVRDEPARGATGGLGLGRGHGDGHQQHVLHHVQVRNDHFEQPAMLTTMLLI